MSHITQFIVVHYDGHSQSIVGSPKPNRKSVEAEIDRLVNEEGYEASELQLVQVPN